MLRLLLAVIVFIGQVHACWASFVLPTGDTCQKCPSLIAPTKGGPVSWALPTDGENCLACCNLQGCDDTHDEIVKTSTLGMDISLPIGTVLVLVVPEQPSEERVCTSIQQHFANAPPREHPSRAPPSSLN